jgi:hypothetical protein
MDEATQVADRDARDSGPGPAGRRLSRAVALHRKGALEIAVSLTVAARTREYLEVGCESVVGFGVRHGLSEREARDFADLGTGLETDAELEPEVRRGEVTLSSACRFGQMCRDPRQFTMLPGAPDDAPPVTVDVGRPAWRRAAKEMDPGAFRRLCDQRAAQVRAGKEPVRPLTVYLTDRARDDFGRARDIACRKAKAVLPASEAFVTIVEHYLASFDPLRVTPGKRRVGDTHDGGRSRYVPREVWREVHGRRGGRCIVPGCRNQIWIEMAHVEPHRDGGSRESANIIGPCFGHHRMFDEGLIRMTGTAKEPVFWDSRGREIVGHVPIPPEVWQEVDDDWQRLGERDPPSAVEGAAASDP